MKLSGIAKGNLQEKAFIEEISDYTEELIREIKAGTQTFRHDNLTNKKCPQCGKKTACGQWKEQQNAGMSGQGMRLSGNSFQNIQCEMPEMP